MAVRRLFPSVAPRLRAATALVAFLLALAISAPAPAAGQAPTPALRAPHSLTRADVAVALRYGPPADTMGTIRDQRDRWIARDKALHVSVSGLLTLSAQYVFEQKAGWDRRRAALPAAVGSAAAVGVAKEVYDTTQPTGTASAKDLAANVVGIGAAVGIILL